jgi:hypothetical protein
LSTADVDAWDRCGRGAYPVTITKSPGDCAGITQR